MKTRHYTFLVLLLSVFTALADKKMTIRNSYTGESFEVSVPNGMRIYEYNSNWLDSIPYLLERARYGEPWAYEAIGDCYRYCYRYGKGGVDKSMFKTFFYYELAGMDVEQKVAEAIEQNPTDQFGNTVRLIDILENGDLDLSISFIDTLCDDHSSDAKVIKDLVCETDTNTRIMLLERNIISPEVSTDKMMFTIFGCVAMNWFPKSFREKKEIVYAVGDKLPYLYDAIAISFFNKSHEDINPDTIARKSATAITFLEKADVEAMLSRTGAEILYQHYQSEIEAGRMTFDTENMERLSTLARLQNLKPSFSLTNRIRQ